MVPSSASDESVSANDLDCSIYVDSASQEAVLKAVERKLGGTTEMNDVLVSSTVRVYVAHNDYEGDSTDPSDFIGWPSVLECEILNGVNEETYMEDIGASLSALWETGFRAVAACNFEDRLPRGGGIGLYS
ncbi:hypothetical protein [Streptomyces sp. NPDC050263]|uniref:hypothetical protein n=1 Tax=Streptomyces sp. NPDC050263 TaxID=3155037 RepID=UPI0034329575